MDGFPALIVYAVPAALVAFIIFWFVKRGGAATGANSSINFEVEGAKQELEQRGFTLVNEWPGSYMNAALAMRREGEVSVHFDVGRRAIQQQRVDKKLLGRSRAELAQVWWIQACVELAEPEAFPSFALRRRHAQTEVAWGVLKPGKKWTLAQHATGDARFDEHFEVLVGEALRNREVLDAETRDQILSLCPGGFFDDLIVCCSPHDPRWLVAINPPPAPGRGNAPSQCWRVWL